MRVDHGGAFVPGQSWGPSFAGAYLFADYVCGRIFRLDPDGSGGYVRSDFAPGLGANSAVALTFGPWRGGQSLYYSTYAAGGQIRRISRTAGAVDDYNGDGRTDVAVYRPSQGAWYVQGQPGATWGASGDIPAPGDYDGDGTTDVAVFRPSQGAWYVRGQAGTTWGSSGDVVLPLAPAIRATFF